MQPRVKPKNWGLTLDPKPIIMLEWKEREEKNKGNMIAKCFFSFVGLNLKSFIKKDKDTFLQTCTSM